MKCVFCELPEIKERTIIREKLAFAFLSNMPIVPGHLLICPNRCVAKIEDLTQEELKAILSLQSQLKKALTKLFGAEGFNYAWNEEKIAGQSVPHFHLHVVPRKKDDESIYEYEPRKFLYRPGNRTTSPEKELKEIAVLIRKEL